MELPCVLLIAMIVSNYPVFSKQDKKVFVVKTNPFSLIHNIDMRKPLFSTTYSVLTFNYQRSIWFKYSIKLFQAL